MKKVWEWGTGNLKFEFGFELRGNLRFEFGFEFFLEHEGARSFFTKEHEGEFEFEFEFFWISKDHEVAQSDTKFFLMPLRLLVKDTKSR